MWLLIRRACEARLGRAWGFEPPPRVLKTRLVVCTVASATVLARPTSRCRPGLFAVAAPRTGPEKQTEGRVNMSATLSAQLLVNRGQSKVRGILPARLAAAYRGE